MTYLGNWTCVFSTIKMFEGHTQISLGPQPVLRHQWNHYHFSSCWNQMNCLYECKGIPRALREGETANQRGKPHGWAGPPRSAMCLKSLHCWRKHLPGASSLSHVISPQPSNNTQGGKFAFNWLLTYPCPSVCLLFTLAVWKSKVFPFTFHSAGETGLLSSLLISTAWDPLSQTLPSTICLYYLIAVSFSSSCYYEMSTGSFWPKTTQESRTGGGGEQLLIFEGKTGEIWESINWVLQPSASRSKITINLTQ